MTVRARSVLLATLLALSAAPLVASADDAPAPLPFFARGTEPSCEPEGDASPAIERPTPLPHPVLCRGTLSIVDPAQLTDNIDAYSFELAAFEIVPVTATSRTLHIQMCAYDPTGANTACGGLADGAVSLQIGGLAGRWTIRVATLTGTGFGEYVLAAQGVDTGAGVDCGTDQDAPGSSEAYGGPGDLSVPFPLECAGSLPAGDSIDWYEIPLPGDSFVEIRAVGDAAPVQICVLAPDYASYRCEYGTFNLSRVATAADAGAWHFAVYHWGEAPTNYALEVVAVDAIEQDDCGSGADASWRRETALAIAWPLACEGAIDAFDNDDLFAFELQRDQFLRVAITSAVPMLVCYEDPASPISDRCAWSPEDLVLRFGDKDGRWLVRIVSKGGPAAYTLDVSLIERPPEDDCGLGRDAQDAIDPGWDAIPFPVSCTATIDELDEGDYYEIALAGGALVEARVQAPGLPWACLVSPTGEDRYCFDDGDFRRVFRVEDGGMWRLNIVPLWWDEGLGVISYSMSFAEGSPAPEQDDCGLGRDALNGHHEPIAFPTACSGYLDYLHGDLWDIYDVSVPDGLAWRYVVDAPPGAYVCLAYDDWSYSCERALTTFWATGPLRIYVGADEPTDGYAYSIRIDGARSQLANGTFVSGTPIVDAPTAPGDAADGVVGEWLRLDQTAKGGGQEHFSLETGALLGGEADFYDADLQRVEGGCTADGPITSGTCGEVPAGAAWVYVTADVGASVAWRATYEYFVDA